MVNFVPENMVSAFDVLDRSMTPKGEASLWVGATCDATLQDSQHCVLMLST